MNPLDTLEQALTTLSHQDLLDLVLKLSSEHADFRRILLTDISLFSQTPSPESSDSLSLEQEAREPEVTKQLKQEISSFFNEIKNELRYSYYDREYDEDEDYPELNSFLEESEELHLLDQIEVLWHFITCGNEMFETEEFIIGTPQLQHAISLYADAVSQLELSHQDKRLYFDLMLDALSWEMGAYGSIRTAVENAIATLCTIPEDYHYLIQQFQNSNYARANELIASYYRQVGDDKSYLQVRQANLQTAAQYLELAEYWQQQGEQTKYLAVLEQWVSHLLATKQESGSNSFYSTSSLDSQTLFQKLLDHYQYQQDDHNLHRILMTQAECRAVSLDLYQQVQAVSTRLGTWEIDKPKLLDLAQPYSQTLAGIYLYEQDWEAAIQLAHDRTSYEPVKVQIANRVKEQHPEAAIQIYQQLVQHYINMQSRKYYAIAARYAEAIKSIYLSILNDQGAWASYINDILQRYPRHRALQEELRRV